MKVSPLILVLVSASLALHHVKRGLHVKKHSYYKKRVGRRLGGILATKNKIIHELNVRKLVGAKPKKFNWNLFFPTFSA